MPSILSNFINGVCCARVGPEEQRTYGTYFYLISDGLLNIQQSYWHHLQRKRIGEAWAIACFCPSGTTGSCVHLRFARDYGEEHFPDDDVQLNGKNVLSGCAVLMQIHQAILSELYCSRAKPLMKRHIPTTSLSFLRVKPL